MAKSKTCVRKKIVICKKGVKRCAENKARAVFMGHAGANCPARRKPSTSHLKPWKTAMAAAAHSCKRETKGGHAFRNCVAGRLKSVRG